MSAPKIQLEQLGAKDERLEYLLDQVKQGVRIFIEAIRTSSAEQEALSFRAFTLKSDKPEEVKAVFDVIMSAVAIELAEQAMDLVKSYTFYHSIEEEDGSRLYLHCKKVAPPTKEEIDAMASEAIAASEDSRTVQEVLEEVDTDKIEHC